MSRRRQSGLEDLIDVASRLPWWVAFAITPLTYFLLHPFSELPLPTAANAHELSSAITGQIIRTGAMIGQYVLPFVLVAGGIVSAARAFKTKKLYTSARAQAGASDLIDITWREFEQLVGEYFRQQGFVVSETPPGPDGGVDLEMRKNGELHLVQCKRWRAYKVGVEIVRELYGVMSARGAAGGYVVTSGVFTKEAERFAHGRNIDLWDGIKLKAKIRCDIRRAPHNSANQLAVAEVQPISEAPVPRPHTPNCPVCGGGMVLRTARRGAGTGQRFWGCCRYPKCRGTMTAVDA